MRNNTFYIDEEANFNLVKMGVDYNDQKQLMFQERTWGKFLADNSPMGNLFLSNTLFSSLDEGEIVIIHATASFEAIKASKRIYCSGGSFGGCVYGTPLRLDNKLHNLMEFILEEELPCFLKHKGNKNSKIKILAIKIKGISKITKAVMPINYMDFGETYSNIFLEMVKREVFTNNQIRQLKQDIDNQLRVSNTLIKMLLNLKKLRALSNLEFISLFEKSVKNTVVLKIAYFETILEYCFLFQNDLKAYEKFEDRELYNFNVKTMIFKLNPRLFREFDLKNFDVSVNEITRYLKNCSKQNFFIIDFSEKHFLNFFKWRFAHNVRYHFLKGQFVWNNTMTLEDFVKKNKFFAGHMILRSSKNPYSFESLFAKKLWEKLDKSRITILTYENLPKGEVGIIPNSKFRYEVYDTTLRNGRVKLTGKLDITLVKKLVDHKQSIMRTHYGTN